MTIPRVPRAGRVAGSRRKHRPRSVPRWLLRSQDLDAFARNRCLLVLSVLSGEQPVTDAVVQAKISRATYYKLETRALNAMLMALNPLTATLDGAKPNLSVATHRLEALQAKVKTLEQEKRRLGRLLLLTRKSLRTPRFPLRRGRPPKDPFSILRPKPRSVSSTAKVALDALSMPTPGGAAGS